jgi:hypothetical protein
MRRGKAASTILATQDARGNGRKAKDWEKGNGS